MANLEPINRNVRHRIAHLPKLSREELLTLWKDVYGREAPTGMRRELLIPFLAYRIQEKTFGGLKPSIRAELRRISRALDKGDYPAKGATPPRISSGTRIGRSWRGKRHEVLVTESGFEYDGMKYGSLSQIARKITGVRWSGPAFFRLNGTRSVRSQQDE